MGAVASKNGAPTKEALLTEFYAGVDAFKNRLQIKAFLFGETPVYADYALYGVIGNVHYITQQYLAWKAGNGYRPG